MLLFSLSFWLVSKFWNSVLVVVGGKWWLETFSKLDEKWQVCKFNAELFRITAITHFWTVCGICAFPGKRKGDVARQTSLSFSSGCLLLNYFTPGSWPFLTKLRIAFMLIFYSWRGLTNFVIFTRAFPGALRQAAWHTNSLCSQAYGHIQDGRNTLVKYNHCSGCPLFLQFGSCQYFQEFLCMLFQVHDDFPWSSVTVYILDRWGLQNFGFELWMVWFSLRTVEHQKRRSRGLGATGVWSWLISWQNKLWFGGHCVLISDRGEKVWWPKNPKQKIND